jgi:NAD(P)-dependent dehydrogenase (short-subunit alcohol dehydrogenase family)
MERAPVAIVTAGSKGIGAAIARLLSADGYRLVLMSSSGDAEEVADELGAPGLTGSVTSSEDVARLLGNAVEEFGQVDAVVNNTGHLPKGDLLEIPDDDWHTGLDLVLLNVVRMARVVAR